MRHMVHEERNIFGFWLNLGSGGSVKCQRRWMETTSRCDCLEPNLTLIQHTAVISRFLVIYNRKLLEMADVNWIILRGRKSEVLNYSHPLQKSSKLTWFLQIRKWNSERLWKAIALITGWYWIKTKMLSLKKCSLSPELSTFHLEGRRAVLYLKQKAI
jgi:hypothetical protein